MRRSHWLGLLVLLVALVSVSVHAEPITLHFLFADYQGQPWTKVQEALVAEWNAANPDIQVELIYGTAGYVNLDQRMQLFYAAGQPVDIYENYREWTHHLIREGVLLDLIPFMEKDGVLDEYATDFGLDPDDVRANPEQYREFFASLPSFGVIDAGMLYSPQMFDEAGVPQPPVSWTWDEFREAARRMTRPSWDGTATEYGFLYEGNFLYQWMWQNGLMALWSKDADGNYSFDLGTPEGRETLEFLAGLFRDGIATATNAVTEQQFGPGHGAMRMGHFSSLPNLKAQDISASITRRPYNKEEVAFRGDGWFHLHLVRSGDPVREAAAWEFIKWRTSREMDLRSAMEIGMFPWRASNLTSEEFRAHLETMEFRDEAFLIADYMFEVGRLIYRPSAPFRSGASPNLGGYMHMAILGTMPIPEAIEKTTEAFYAELMQ